MANRENLDEALERLQTEFPEDVLEAYNRDTTFARNPSFIRNVRPMITGEGVEFSVPEYVQFLDEGTRFIDAQPFITPVLEGDEIEEIITNAFEQDIDETIQEAT